jgi:hypothetical protein
VCGQPRSLQSAQEAISEISAQETISEISAQETISEISVRYSTALASVRLASPEARQTPTARGARAPWAAPYAPARPSEIGICCEEGDCRLAPCMLIVSSGNLRMGATRRDRPSVPGSERPSGSEAVTSCPSSSNSCLGHWSPYPQGWAVMGDPPASGGMQCHVGRSLSG